MTECSSGISLRRSEHSDAGAVSLPSPSSASFKDIFKKLIIPFIKAHKNRSICTLFKISRYGSKQRRMPYCSCRAALLRREAMQEQKVFAATEEAWRSPAAIKNVLLQRYALCREGISPILGSMPSQLFYGISAYQNKKDENKFCFRLCYLHLLV